MQYFLFFRYFHSKLFIPFNKCTLILYMRKQISFPVEMESLEYVTVFKIILRTHLIFFIMKIIEVLCNNLWKEIIQLYLIVIKFNFLLQILWISDVIVPKILHKIPLCIKSSTNIEETRKLCNNQYGKYRTRNNTRS